MADPEIQPIEAPKKTFWEMTGEVLGNTFEEAKLAFYVTILCSFLALGVCHWLKEIGSLSSLLTGMWTGFGVLIGKIGWGKNG